MGMFDQIAVADGTQLLLGRGALFLDRLTAGGAKQGFNFVGNCTGLEIAPSIETREKRGMVDNTNPLLARVEVSRTLEVNITISEYKKEQVAIALLGDVGEYTQTATPIVGETLNSSSVKGRTYYTAKRKITAVTLKDDGVSKTLNTDYYMDAETGAITVIPSGSIADGSVLTIDYTPTVMTAGVSGYVQVSPGSAGTIICEARFIGKPMQGKVHEAQLWKMQINPQGVLALLSDDFVDFQLRGTLLSDAINHPAPLNFGAVLQY